MGKNILLIITLIVASLILSSCGKDGSPKTIPYTSPVISNES